MLLACHNYTLSSYSLAPIGFSRWCKNYKNVNMKIKYLQHFYQKKIYLDDNFYASYL